VNDDELRALIRVAIQRHLTADPSIRLKPDTTVSFPQSSSVVPMSFGQYQLERAADDTMCLIEPAVRCNHCGFCKCHGHGPHGFNCSTVQVFKG
jgi:hypothetical protein